MFVHPAVNTGNIFSTYLNGCELVSEFSKTVRFDFPRIPVIGALLLLILIINSMYYKSLERQSIGMSG